jgi:hypothetical protein
MSGSQTFQFSSTKVVVFGMRPGHNERDFLNKFGDIVGPVQRIYASEDNYEEHGVWRKSHCTIPEGTLVMVMVQSSRNGASHADAIVLLRLRDTGPLLQVLVRLGSNRKATYTELPAFVGRADILSVEEAAEYGYTLSPGFVSRFFTQEEVDELIDILELAGGTEPPPDKVIVDVGQGQTRAIAVAPAGRRRVRIRR